MRSSCLQAVGPLMTSLLLTLPVNPAFADSSLLERAKVAASAGDAPVYSYRMAFSTSRVSMEADVEPWRAEGKRLHVLSSSADDEDDLERAIEEADKTAARGYWCGEVLLGVGNDARRFANDARSVSYRFQPQPTGSRNDSILEHLTGEVRINRATAGVEYYRLHAPNPFRQALVAKINTFSITMECSPTPGGPYFAHNFAMSLSGSAAFRKFDEAVTRSLTLLGAPATLAAEDGDSTQSGQ